MALVDLIYIAITATKIDYQAPIPASIVSLLSIPPFCSMQPRSLTNISSELDLPEYESYEILRQQVYTAMTAGSEYFGFA